MLTEYDVFISYSHLDTDWVKEWLHPRLESAGLTVCIDYRDFDIGVPSLTNMENAAERSRKTLLVLTPNWVKSEWTKFESLVTQTDDPSGVRQRTLPLLLEKCELPKRLGIFTYADFTEKTQWDAQLARVISAITGEPTSQSTKKSILQPNLVHPYPLQANFTGRVKERQELTAWLSDDEHPIFELVAMGGMGKSALTWYWLTRDVLPANDLELDAVMWWSFYEGESSFSKFVDEALRYVGTQPINAEQYPTTYDRAQELRRLLQDQQRVLIVLDGFERQLRDYAILDAAYKPHDDAERSEGARSCVDPISSRLLRSLAATTTHAKVLITSRLTVSDLQDRAGDPLAGVSERELKELSRQDAIAFMRAQGVIKGTDKEIANVCEGYGYHPLSLRLLSGLIVHDAKTPADIAAAPRHEVFNDLVQRQHHVLEQSYEALPKRERTLLSSVSAFRAPVGYDTLEIFNTFRSEKGFEEALDHLRVRGLLQRHTDHNRYDLHPLVRRFAYDRLSDKKHVHDRLRDYFAELAAFDEEQVQNLADLGPLIELYHHTVRAGRKDEANKLLHARLATPLFFRFGAPQILIELVSLVTDWEDRPPTSDKGYEARSLSLLAASYGVSGQSRRAVPLYEQNLAIREQQGDRLNLAIGLSAVAQVAYLPLGELRKAEEHQVRSLELANEIDDPWRKERAQSELGRVLLYCGRFKEAEAEFASAFALATEGEYTQDLGTISAYRALRALLIGNARSAMRAALRARDFADTAASTAPSERDLIRHTWLLASAKIMEGMDLQTAATHLTDALTRCRRSNLVDLEPSILLAWAQWYRAKGNQAAAQAHAEEAIGVADRCEYRLNQAEIHNFLAHLALDAGDRETSRKEAEIAKERAWCDGPPHCYKPALDEAEKMLKELAAL